MLNLIVDSKPNIFSAQKATVGYDFIPKAHKYALIPIYKDVRSLCKLIPSPSIQSDYCSLDYTVVQFTNVENALKASQKLVPNTKIDRQDIRVINDVIRAETVSLTVIFDDHSKLEKWRHNEELANSLRNVLVSFVIVDSCLVVLPNDGITNHDFRCINILSTGSKVASRVTASSVIKIEETMSYDQFEKMCLMRNPLKIFGLEKQYKFLETIYEAHAALKKLEISKDSKLIQKVSQ